MMGQVAPVVLFAYNRPKHLELALQTLSENVWADQTPLFVYVDGPRNDEDRKQQSEILKVLSSGLEKKFKSLSVVHSEKNRGLANSIVAGVTARVTQFGRVIVLEDDLVSSKYFLQFMNESLEKYKNEEQVISVHGYVNPIEVGSEAFFLKGADCWGWATWKRGWALFEPNGERLLNELIENGQEVEFNYKNNYNYIRMLQDQITGKNNSWAIRWYASAFLKNKLTLYPPRSLIKNIGIDGSGTHCDISVDFDVDLAQAPIEKFPKKIESSTQAYQAYCRFFASIKPGFLKKIGSFLKRLI